MAVVVAVLQRVCTLAPVEVGGIVDKLRREARAWRRDGFWAH